MTVEREVTEHVLSASGIVELKQLIAAAEQRMEEMENEGVVTLAAQFEQMAAELGLTAKQVLAKARKQAGNPHGSRRNGEGHDRDLTEH